jgi:hypothetical protein
MAEILDRLAISADTWRIRLQKLRSGRLFGRFFASLKLRVMVGTPRGLPIESALSVTRRVTGRVTHWRDGDLLRRWCVAGLLRAEGQFRRIKGHRALSGLVKALKVMTRGQPPGSSWTVA